MTTQYWYRYRISQKAQNIGKYRTHIVSIWKTGISPPLVINNSLCTVLKYSMNTLVLECTANSRASRPKRVKAEHHSKKCVSKRFNLDCQASGHPYSLIGFHAWVRKCVQSRQYCSLMRVLLTRSSAIRLAYHDKYINPIIWSKNCTTSRLVGRCNVVKSTNWKRLTIFTVVR